MAQVTQELKQHIRAAKQADPSLTNPVLGQRFGIHKSTVSAILNEKPVQKVDDPPATLTETSEVKGDTWELTIPRTPIHTVEQLLEHAQVDQTIWQVDRFLLNKYEQAAKDNDGNLKVQPLFQVKAFLKRRKNMVDAKAEIEALKAEAKQHMRTPNPVVHTTLNSANMYEVLCPDLHVAKLCWGRETGFQNYDTTIAVETYRRAIDALIQSVGSTNLDKIVLGVGNDILQADNIQGTTFSGTKVDVDSRYRKTYVIVRKMIAEIAEKLRHIAPVELKVVPGNHDTLSSFTLGDSLECTFAKYTDVTVDNTPTLHKTVEWGDVFLALMHGDKGKQTKYGMWMATTFPKEFGRTKFREIHLGHRHTTAVTEEFGVRLRTFSSLSGTDEWHGANLFTSNLRVAEGLVWNKHRGLVSQHYHTEVD